MSYEATQFITTVQAKKQTKKDQAETQDAAEKAGDTWTDKEIRFLECYRASGMTAKEIALVLGRTLYAVRGRMHLLDHPVVDAPATDNP